MTHDRLHVEEAEFVPASKFAQRVGYTTDYLSKLARDGKVASRKIGRQWYVQPASVFAFVKAAELQKEERREQIRVQRLRELDLHRRNEMQKMHVVSAIDAGRHIAFAETVLIAVFGLVASVLIYAAPTNYVAAPGAAGSSFFEYLALSVYDLLAPVRVFVNGEQEPSEPHTLPSVVPVELEHIDRNTETPNTRTASAETETSLNRTGIMVFPPMPLNDRTQGIKEMFSDPVRVMYDDETKMSGVIVPEFKHSEDEMYRFIMVSEDSPDGS